MEATRVTLSPNPRQRASLLSILTFWWTIDMFRKGYSQKFEISDLYKPLDEDHANRLGDRLESEWNRQLERQKQTPAHSPSLVRAIFRTLWKEWLTLSVLALFAEVVLRLLQPIFLGRMLLYFREGSTMTHEEAVYYACGMVAVRAIIVLCDNQYGIISVLTGVKAKIAVCSVVFRKSLRLSRNALGDTSPGKMVNLMSNDVNRFDIASYLVCFMWTSPVVMLLASILLWYEIGWSGVLGLVAIVIITPIQSYTGTLTSRYRLRTALKTDERIRLMDEIIAGIAVIKMYAWERPFAKLISQARAKEMREVLKSGYLRALYMSFQLFTTRAAILGVMLAFIALEEDITAAKVFVAASYLSNVSYTMAGLFGRGIAELGEGLVATRRLQRFLEYDEVQQQQQQHQRQPRNVPKDEKTGENGNVGETKRLLDDAHDGPLAEDVAVSMRHLTARWAMPDELHETIDKQQEVPATLSDLDIQFKRGRLIGIVGPVGSGKSSILQVLLRELPVESGSLLMGDRTIAYASQEPWLFTGSLRQNIVFGDKLDQHRYRQVLRVCALQPDLANLIEGDLTVIGERGVSLSGGQKARICLARAVYRKADVYLLDDPLSAVDAHVAKHLFELCIGNRGFIKRHNPDATRILVTHQVHFLKQADWVVVMKEGKVEAQGTPHDLQRRGIELEHLEPAESSEDVTMHTFTRTVSHTSTTSTVTVDSATLVALTSGALDDEATARDKFEATSQGAVPGSVFLQYVSSAGSWLIFVGLILLFAITQLVVSVADWWLSLWTANEEGGTMTSADAGDVRNQTSPDWTDSLDRQTCLIVHVTLVATIFFVAIMRAFGFYKACARASQTIHDTVFEGFIGARMRFFETNPSGRILNRFSKDMGAMDDQLPKSILDATQTLLMFAGAMMVVVFVQPFFMVPILVLFVVLLAARRVYLRTSQNTRRLEGITRSPIFTHIAATLTGLPTIRSYGVQQLLIDEFDTHQNVNTGAYFMFHSGRIAFGLFLDSIFFLFLSIVTFSYLLLDEDAVGARVGLAITQIGSIGSQLQFGIRQSAEMFNHLIAVERLLEYRELPAEGRQVTKHHNADGQQTKPIPVVPVASDWPQAGAIEFRNVSFRYDEYDEAVLEGLTFTVAPREKVGIVGRTGAGKSSLIAALFRMAHVEGDILIDGINTAHVPLETLRAHVSIIPQDPVLFSGTLRRNLDPFEAYPDAALWRALELVELRELASESSAGLGLQAYVAAGGQNFSVGQRQLLCLARAILRGNRILVLDEATANVDPDTDRLIQHAIREQFADCTVLTIAHRLNTIMDYDRVLVMQDGSVIESGHPAELLTREESEFLTLVLATGADEAENLMKMAHNSLKPGEERKKQ